MYLNSGYLNNTHLDFKDKSRPLIVGSCGTYRLSTHPRLPTYRPRGRLDFQLLYVFAGAVHFHFDHAENETVVTAGNRKRKESAARVLRKPRPSRQRRLQKRRVSKRRRKP